MKRLLISFGLLFFIMLSCNTEKQGHFDLPEADMDKTYTDIPASHSGLEFINEITAQELMSPLQYINVYSGGGVALGDIDNDGLTDIYFTGNISENRLYQNKGGLRFEDITTKAGVACPDSWSTGACMVDINGDGWLDIYVCRAYYDEPKKRENLLFINNKDLTFSEQAEAYGLNDDGYSIMASFFDYDKDGNLDIFIGNHPRDRYLSYLELHENWKNPPLESSNHLYRNLGNGKFSDVTQQANVLSYGWTLGMVTVDLNQDDWPDIYVSVDHTEPDRLYINNKDGTFEETSNNALKHMSHSSMGIDAGDVDNDGLTDIVIVEMLAEDNYRAKTQMANMDVRRFWDFVIKGYNYQYLRNMLQINNGNGTFREIGQMANIQKTDWSWACLFFDMDNDGWQDLFVTNGYYRDYSDQDYRIGYNKRIMQANEEDDQLEKFKLLTQHAWDAASTRLDNYMFKNNRDYTFEDISSESGLDFNSFSNGAAYADLDNDGDLDIVVNNINDKASLFSNNISEFDTENNWLRINLIPESGSSALNSKVWLETEYGTQFQEFTITRGYQSTVEPILHFGIGQANKIKTLKVQWPDGQQQKLENIKPNKVLKLYHSKSSRSNEVIAENRKLFKDVTKESGAEHLHLETYFNDYEKQVLLPHQMSCFGPALDVADINGDGREDFFIGGSQYKPGFIYLQDENGIFKTIASEALDGDKEQEDVGAAFFDADGDGDMDLYVASGGNEEVERDKYYMDRFYLNDGNGVFTKTKNHIPPIYSSGSCVRPFDYDDDGDLDLFVGGRHIPGKYPFPARSYLLENNKGFFKDVTTEKAPDLLEIGMVTDARWTDINQDSLFDLFVVGEWMPLTFLIQDKDGFSNQTDGYHLSETRGWWNCINEVDIDHDGDMDFVVGNLGLNYKYKTSKERPFQIYASDFDENGSNDIVLGSFNNDILFPVRGRECSSEQLPILAEKFPTYDAFARATLEDIYGEQLNTALHYTAHTFQHSLLLNKGNGQYEVKALPKAAQSSPVNSIISKDFDNDGKLDLLMAGNLYVSEIETGRADSGTGFFLKGDGEGNFETHFSQSSGFYAAEDVKHLRLINITNNKQYILVAKNNNLFQVVEHNKDALSGK